jgi:hypothetical protein
MVPLSYQNFHTFIARLPRLRFVYLAKGRRCVAFFSAYKSCPGLLSRMKGPKKALIRRKVCSQNNWEGKFPTEEYVLGLLSSTGAYTRLCELLLLNLKTVLPCIHGLARYYRSFLDWR